MCSTVCADTINTIYAVVVRIVTVLILTSANFGFDFWLTHTQAFVSAHSAVN